MGKIVVLAGSPRKNGNTDRFHTPMRNKFHIKKLGLILVGAAELPELFDAVITQYRLILNFFKLEDAGMVLVRGAKEKGDVRSEDLVKAFKLGKSIGTFPIGDLSVPLSRSL